jgi:hypothetical protein
VIRSSRTSSPAAASSTPSKAATNLTAIAWSARACLDTLLGNPFAEDPLGAPGVRGPDIEPLLAEVRRIHTL